VARKIVGIKVVTVEGGARTCATNPECARECGPPIDGWDGPGWYCVREAGTESDPEATELIEGDQFDDTIEIVSGPYADEAAALEVCPAAPVPEPVETVCCDNATLPSVLKVTASGKTGDWATWPDVFYVTYNPAFGVWENTDVGCTVSGSPVRVVVACDGSIQSNTLIFTEPAATGDLCASPISLTHGTPTTLHSCAGTGTPMTGTISFAVTELP
jgi:hypothetical protein